MCHHCRSATSYNQRPTEMSSQHRQHSQSISVGGGNVSSRSSPKNRSRTPPQQHQHLYHHRTPVGYSPPAKQLAGGRMHEPPRPEDLPPPPAEWRGALEQRQVQAEVEAQLQRMQCDMASMMLKRMLNVSA